MRLQKIMLPACLCILTVLLQGCPKETIDAYCNLNNIVVRNGIRVTPARDSLRLGDTLWLSAAVSRFAWDNNNQRVDLNNKGLNTYVSFAKANRVSNENLQTSDYKLVFIAGSQGETSFQYNIKYSTQLNYTLIGDSLKLLVGFIPQKKGIYEITGAKYYFPQTRWFNSEFYKDGPCYLGLLNDSFNNSNRHGYLLQGGYDQNRSTNYFVQFY